MKCKILLGIALGLLTTALGLIVGLLSRFLGVALFGALLYDADSFCGE